MVKVHVEKVTSGYTFTGYIEYEDLPLNIKLLVADDGLSPTVEGDFSVDWDDDIALVCIETLYIVDEDGKFVCDLTEQDADYDSLAEAIEGSDNGDWMADRIASAADYDFDMER